MRAAVLAELTFGVATLTTVAESVSANPALGLVRIITVAGLTHSMIAIVGHKAWGWWLGAVVAIFALVIAAGPLHHVFRSTEAIPHASIFEVVTGSLVMIVGTIGFVVERRRPKEASLRRR